MITKEVLEYLRTNKRLIVAAKKATIKHGDCVSATFFKEPEPETFKAIASPELMDLDSFNVKVAINTTNIMDSHDDVHFPGIWNKSIKEQKNLYLLQEHKLQFDKIISDEVKAKAVMMSWSELGYSYQGQTQVLLFDASVEKERNTFMAEQYIKGRVKNHSVGMQYVKIDLAINSDDPFDKDEKKIWDKYYPQIVNKEIPDELGYFWAVTEAKLIEGSAVPIGSNQATPTISVGKEPLTTPQEPDHSTQKTGYEIFKY